MGDDAPQVQPRPVDVAAERERSRIFSDVAIIALITLQIAWDAHAFAFATPWSPWHALLDAALVLVHLWRWQRGGTEAFEFHADDDDEHDEEDRPERFSLVRFYSLVLDIVVLMPLDLIVPVLHGLLHRIGSRLGLGTVLEWPTCSVARPVIPVGFHDAAAVATATSWASLFPQAEPCGVPLRFVNVVGLLKLPECIYNLENALSDAVVPRLVGFMLVWLLFTHISAMVWVALGAHEGLGTNSFLPPVSFREMSPFAQYLDAFHWAFMRYEDSVPETPLETWVHFMLVMVRELLQILVMGQVASIISNMDAAAAGHRQRVLITAQYCEQRKLPYKLRERVRKYQQFKYSENHGVQEEEVLAGLNDRTRSDILYFLTGKVLHKVPMFELCPASFVQEVAGKLVSQLYCPGEYIVRKGEIGKDMFIIKQGTLAVVGNTGQVFSRLHPSDHFGELALLFSKKRTASVVAETYAQVYCLNFDSFQAILGEYPELLDQITDFFGDRVASMKETSEHLVDGNVSEDADTAADTLSRSSSFSSIGERAAKHARRRWSAERQFSSTGRQTSQTSVLEESVAGPSPRTWKRKQLQKQFSENLSLDNAAGRSTSPRGNHYNYVAKALKLSGSFTSVGSGCQDDMDPTSPTSSTKSSLKKDMKKTLSSQGRRSSIFNLATQVASGESVIDSGSENEANGARQLGTASSAEIKQPGGERVVNNVEELDVEIDLQSIGPVAPPSPSMRTKPPPPPPLEAEIATENGEVAEKCGGFSENAKQSHITTATSGRRNLSLVAEDDSFEADARVSKQEYQRQKSEEEDSDDEEDDGGEDTARLRAIYGSGAEQLQSSCLPTGGKNLMRSLVSTYLAEDKNEKEIMLTRSFHTSKFSPRHKSKTFDGQSDESRRSSRSSSEFVSHRLPGHKRSATDLLTPHAMSPPRGQDGKTRRRGASVPSQAAKGYICSPSKSSDHSEARSTASSSFAENTDTFEGAAGIVKAASLLNDTLAVRFCDLLTQHFNRATG